jgi:hypothetical protein
MLEYWNQSELVTNCIAPDPSSEVSGLPDNQEAGVSILP